MSDPIRDPVEAVNGVVRAGRSRIPASEVEEVFASSIRPSVRVNVALLMLSTFVGIPFAITFANAHPAGGRGHLVFAGVGFLALYALFQLVWAEEKYCVMIRRGGQELTLWRSDDSQRVISTVARLREALRMPGVQVGSRPAAVSAPPPGG